MKRTKLMLGDNIQSLQKLPENSVDSIVTDPPYGLSFMGKKWDYDVPSVEFWKEVYRVLKPGGHVLSFGGTRTYHRMTVNIEDAGFEIRDQIMWLYGSGFPKSLNIGKVVDKYKKTGNASWNGTGDSSNGALGYSKLQKEQGYRPDDYSNRHQNTDEVENEWKGWGTALKPANEPICVARKPLSEKSVAENVLKWGTGGINIDGCRVDIGDEKIPRLNVPYEHKANNNFGGGNDGRLGTTTMSQNGVEGRFPANIILDEIAGEVLDEQSGSLKSTGSVRKKDTDTDPSNIDRKHKTGENSNPYAGQSGGASRFFYQAKVSKAERNMGLDGAEVSKNVRPQGEAFGSGSAITDVVKGKGNTHPTVKPVSLMSYLVRLVTPPNGIVLDPFMGSGSTGIAARLEGFRFLGMEMDKDYFKIAEARIENYEQYKKFIK